jgi:hypothetical protein
MPRTAYWRWPLIPDPCIAPAPCAIHTAPITHSKSPAIPRDHTFDSNQTAMTAKQLSDIRTERAEGSLTRAPRVTPPGAVVRQLVSDLRLRPVARRAT